MALQTEPRTAKLNSNIDRKLWEEESVRGMGFGGGSLQTDYVKCYALKMGAT